MKSKAISANSNIEQKNESSTNDSAVYNSTELDSEMKELDKEIDVPSKIVQSFNTATKTTNAKSPSSSTETKTITDKTGVIDDPLSRTHSLASIVFALFSFANS